MRGCEGDGHRQRGTEEFADWFHGLERREQDEVIEVVERLYEQGPLLGRPDTDRIAASRYHNMKELRPRGVAKHLRVLHIFDPRREAILLLGGDKTGQWDGWYKTAIPKAEHLYDVYLEDLREEGLLP